DSNPAACAWAERNARDANVGNRVDVRCGAFADGAYPGEQFPLVLADPPYVPTAEVSRFPDDPEDAIDGGDSGLDLIAECLDVAAAHLCPEGAVIIQVRGGAQADAVAELSSALTVQ